MPNSNTNLRRGYRLGGSSSREQSAREERGKRMEIDKSQIVELLKSRGEDAKAAQAEADLPDKVDPEAHASVLAEVGIDPQDLLGDLPGGLGGTGRLIATSVRSGIPESRHCRPPASRSLSTRVTSANEIRRAPTRSPAARSATSCLARGRLTPHASPSRRPGGRGAARRRPSSRRCASLRDGLRTPLTTETGEGGCCRAEPKRRHRPPST